MVESCQSLDLEGLAPAKTCRGGGGLLLLVRNGLVLPLVNLLVKGNGWTWEGILSGLPPNLGASDQERFLLAGMEMALGGTLDSSGLMF